MPGSDAPAGSSTIAELTVLDYSESGYMQNYMFRSTRSAGLSTVVTDHGSGLWSGTDAITRIDLIASTGLFAPGTIVTLWGLG